jgi:hypothetical protein
MQAFGLAQAIDVQRLWTSFVRAPTAIGLGRQGREWRGTAFGAAGRDAVKTDKEAKTV